jgi:hypothetical protein
VGVELAEEAGGGDTIVSTETEGVERVEVRLFGPRTDCVLVIFMEGLTGTGSMFRGVGWWRADIVRIMVFGGMG